MDAKSEVIVWFVLYTIFRKLKLCKDANEDGMVGLGSGLEVVEPFGESFGMYKSRPYIFHHKLA